MNTFVASSNFTKMLSAVFIFLTGVGVGLLILIQTFTNATPQPWEIEIILLIAGQAGTILGVHVGTVAGGTLPQQLVPSDVATQPTTKLQAIGSAGTNK